MQNGESRLEFSSQMVQEWDCDTPLEVAAWSVYCHVLATTSAWYGRDTASRFADFLSFSEPFHVSTLSDCHALNCEAFTIGPLKFRLVT